MTPKNRTFKGGLKMTQISDIIYGRSLTRKVLVLAIVSEQSHFPITNKHNFPRVPHDASKCPKANSDFHQIRDQTT